MPVKISCCLILDSIHYALFPSCGLQLVFLILATKNAGKTTERKILWFARASNFISGLFLITLEEGDLM